MGSVLFAWLPVVGQITLDADFDHGSLDEQNSSVGDRVITLVGRDNFNTGVWKWLHFAAESTYGTRPTFQVPGEFASGNDALLGHAMVYSYDQENWRFFDNNGMDPRRGVFSFSSDAPFTQDRGFVAYGVPYSIGRAQRYTAQVLESQWVTPTLSATSDLVIGQSPGGVDDLGRTISPHDLYGYRITDPSAVGAKMKVAIVSGIHANETLASYTLEGLVDFLLGNDAQAVDLRRRAESYVYPMANPDGRFAGYNRSTVEREDLDPNRCWNSPRYGGLSDTGVVGDALVAETSGEVDYFLDLHSTVDGKQGQFGFIHPDYQGDPFWQTLVGWEPELNTFDESFVDRTAQRFGRDELDAGYTMTFETQFLPGEGIDRFLDLGRNLGLALAEGARVAGDLNHDQVVDSADWELLIGQAEMNLAGLSPSAAYPAGDLDGDGLNSLSDSAALKAAYRSANGPGSFERLISGVPEPSTIVLFAAGMPHALGERRYA